jgi:hypothetical protein
MIAAAIKAAGGVRAIAVATTEIVTNPQPLINYQKPPMALPAMKRLRWLRNFRDDLNGSISCVKMLRSDPWPQPG